MKQHDATFATMTAPPSPSDPTRPGDGGSSSEQPAAHDNRPIAPEQVRDRGRYRILGEHGRGGLGRVARAHDRELRRDVAIKELLSRNDLRDARFVREAMITARLEHPGIVAVHEAGRWDDGTPFYAMKLVSGRPLRDLIAERTTVAERITLLHHVIAVADAIAYAHGRNIIHRDLKPANVIVGDFGETVVIDWGLAKDISIFDDLPSSSGDPHGSHDSEIGVDLTLAGAVLGTPTYMAPEQERGEQVDQRADVFAIGAMLWELCSLQRVPPSEPRQRRRLLKAAGIDADLATIIDKALAPSPSHRYFDAGELAADLKAFKAGARIAARNYSLISLLAHWTRRHRTLAAGTLTAVILLATIISVALVSISRQKAQAVAAKEAAVLASAAALLERDPTLAWDMIRAAAPSSEADLLKARIRAAGVADTTLGLPGRIDKILLTPSGTHLVLSASNRCLYEIDIAGALLKKLAEHLTEPSVFTIRDSTIYFVRKTQHLALASVPLHGGEVRDLVALDGIPRRLNANDRGVFWLSPNGALRQLQSDAEPRIVAQNTQEFALLGDEVVMCDNTGKIRLLKQDHPDETIGDCPLRWHWEGSDYGFAIPVNTEELLVSRNQKRASLPLDLSVTMPHVKVSRTGLVVATSRVGAGYFARATDKYFQYARLNARPMFISTFENYAAWGLRDGSVKIIETRSGKEWVIQAHPDEMSCLVMLPHDRFAACGRRSLRFWTLPQTAPALIAQTPAPSYNIVFNEKGDILLDGGDGRTSLIEHGSTAATVIHTHDEAAFGVSWCGSLACSSGWDTKVLCTAIGTPGITSTTELPAPSPWIASNGRRCYASSMDGGIFDVQGGPNPLYAHDHEPYRHAISKDGDLIASADWGGTVKVYSISKQRLLATRNAVHDGLITNVAWNTSSIVTSGSDAIIKIMTTDLTDVYTSQLRAPVRYLAVSNKAIYAGLENGTVWMHSLTDNSERIFRIDATITALALSPDETTAAIGTASGDLIVIDGLYKPAAVRVERGRISCLSL